jgi:hypothetical protein
MPTTSISLDNDGIPFLEIDSFDHCIQPRLHEDGGHEAHPTETATSKHLIFYTGHACNPDHKE